MLDLAIIVAMDKNRLIGSNNHLPWHIPEDLHRFREITLGHNVIMGKNTYLSIGKPLDQRTNIILTTNTKFFAPGCIICNTIEDTLWYIRDEVSFVIGGASIFEQFINIVNKLYLTLILDEFEGNKYFPDYDASKWELTYYENVTSKNGIKYINQNWTRLK